MMKRQNLDSGVSQGQGKGQGEGCEPNKIFLNFQSVADFKPISSLVDLFLSILPNQPGSFPNPKALLESLTNNGPNSPDINDFSLHQLSSLTKVLHVVLHLDHIDRAVIGIELHDDSNIPFVLRTMTAYLIKNGIDQFQKWVNGVQVRLVSTVHPNETERSSNLRHYEALFTKYLEWKKVAESIKILPIGSTAYRARREQMNQLRRVIKSEIEALWQSEQIRKQPIKVNTEAARILERYKVIIDCYPSWVKFIKHLCTEAFWRYVASTKTDPDFYSTYSRIAAELGAKDERVLTLEALKSAFRSHYQDSIQRPRIVTPPITFGTWKGGDRDGNPFVVASFTNETFIKHKEFILGYYIKAIQELQEKITSSENLIEISEDLRDRIKKYSKLFPYVEGVKNEPYMNMLRYMLELLTTTLSRVQDTLKGWGPTIKPLMGHTRTGPNGYESAEQFLSDVKSIYYSLVNNKGKSQARSLIQDLYILVDTFGFHMLSLDFRQLSTKNTQTIEEYLNATGVISSKDFSALKEPERVDLLLKLFILPDLNLESLIIEDLSPTSRDTLHTLIIMADAISMEPRSVGKFIISMCSEVSDILTIFILLKITGIIKVSAGVITSFPCDVTGLFETVSDMENCTPVMEKLLSIPIIRNAIITHRGSMLPVMLGYSDSVRDGSSLASDAQINRTSLNLRELELRLENQTGQKVEFVFYRGRGDTIPRGFSGKIDNTIACQVITTRVEDHTEQNRYLRNYMSGPTTTDHFHRVYSAHLSATNTTLHPLTNIYQSFFDYFAKFSRQSWVELVREDEGTGYRGKAFFKYLNNYTILPHLAHSHFASRPISRAGNWNIDSIRAIPFTMVLAQARDFSVAFYGAGKAFEVGVQYLSSPVTTLQKLIPFYWKELDSEGKKSFKNFNQIPTTTTEFLTLLATFKIDVKQHLEAELDSSLSAVLSLYPTISQGIDHFCSLLKYLSDKKISPLQMLREMFQNYLPFKFSLENKEAAVVIHNKEILDSYVSDAPEDVKEIVELIGKEAELVKKWVLQISEQTVLKNKYSKDTDDPKLTLLHKIQGHLLKYHRDNHQKMNKKDKETLENYIQMTILAVSEGLGFGG